MVTHITWSRQKDTACDKPHPWRYRRLPLLSAAALIILITTGMSLTLLPIPAFANTASPIHRLSLPSGLGLVGTLSGISTISCPTKVDCLAAGDGTRGAVILRSSNGGASWSRVTLPLGLGLVGHKLDDVSTISCPTKVDCLAAGEGTRGAVILRSSNGGASWSRVTLPRGLVGHNLNDVWETTCPTKVDCLVAGEGTRGAVILRSSNGGASWSQATLPTGLVGHATGDLASIACPTTNQCLAVGEGTTGAVLLRSSNGGASWSRVTPPKGPVGHATGDLASIACPTTNQCLAVGYDSAKPRLLILRSSNSGASWSRVTPPKGLGLISHHVVLYKLACTQGECLAAGVGAGPAVLLSSSNGGASWSRVTLPPGLGLINHPSGAIAALSCPSQAKCLAGLGLDTKGAMIVSIAMRGLAHSSSGLALSVIVIVVVFVLVIGGVVLGRRRNQHIPVAPDSTK
ncbi:hypothetical protein [Ferrimicrobium sp.]|uniref:WD40/YVTN/BNR-like repeat-containing protein n=1 Tax=Ferrimicrobium sp. TaxID=2926050 RepID=UPI00261F0B12|nr:hypothetical protein [Ferrimicrobium sp.]